MNNSINPFTTTIPALESVTEKYRFISTAEFIKDVQSLGYNLENTRGPRTGYGMHSMVFSHPNMPKIAGLDLRLLATNSHNGTSAFRLYIQVGVGICANTLVAFVPELAKQSRIVHRGYALSKVAAAVEATRTQIETVLNQAQLMQGTQVSPEAAAKFLFEAAKLRNAVPFRIMDLQRVQYRDQTENNAWNVFNRVQDSIIRGGYVTQEEHPKTLAFIPGRKARAITAIKDQVKTNYKLWQLAVETLLKDAA